MLTIEKAGCFLFLGTMSLFDIRTKRLPDVSLVLGLVASVLVRIAFRGQPFYSYAAAAFVGFIFVIISYLTNEKIGYGDSFVILSIGILVGLENLLFILFAAFVMASFFGMVILVSRNFKSDKGIPFVPFIFAAFILLILFQNISA